MDPYQVVFCDIVYQVFIFLFPEYVEMILSDSVSDGINLMYIARDLFCYAVPLTVIYAALLSVATGVGGCRCLISSRAVLVEVYL